MALVNQASRFPTRKIMAVIISGMITGAAQSLLRYFWPDHPFSPYMEDVDIWLQGMIMVYAGYMTKESVNENSDESSRQAGQLQELDDGSSTQLVFSFVREAEETRGGVGVGEQTAQTERGAS